MAFIFWVVAGYNCIASDLSWYKEYNFLLESMEFATRDLSLTWYVIWVNYLISLSLMRGMCKLHEVTFLRSLVQCPVCQRNSRSGSHNYQCEEIAWFKWHRLCIHDIFISRKGERKRSKQCEYHNSYNLVSWKGIEVRICGNPQIMYEHVTFILSKMREIMLFTEHCKDYNGVEYTSYTSSYFLKKGKTTPFLKQCFQNVRAGWKSNTPLQILIWVTNIQWWKGNIHCACTQQSESQLNRCRSIFCICMKKGMALNVKMHSELQCH